MLVLIYRRVFVMEVSGAGFFLEISSKKVINLGRPAGN